MRLLISISTVVLISTAALGQTKKIAHRSHSGKNSHFNLKSIDNLGIAPTRNVRVAKLDTLKFLPDDRVVMITSAVCFTELRHTQETYDTTIWRPGNDTLSDHNLFNRNNELEKIKIVLKQEYNFKNNIDEVVFIGHNDSLSSESEKKSDIRSNETSTDKHEKPKRKGKTQPKKARKKSRIDHSMLWFLVLIPFASIGLVNRRP